jgi:hypothetical protein
MRAAVLVGRDVIDIGKARAGLAQAIGMASDGKPAQCLMRRKRSSSAAAISTPSRRIAAAESPWNALSPRTIME